MAVLKLSPPQLRLKYTKKTGWTVVVPTTPTTGGQVKLLGQYFILDSTEHDSVFVGVQSQTSSNPEVVYIGPAVERATTPPESSAPILTSHMMTMMVGIGESEVCTTWRDDTVTCSQYMVETQATSTAPIIDRYHAGSCLYYDASVYGEASMPCGDVNVTAITSSDASVIEVSPTTLPQGGLGATAQGKSTGVSEMCFDFSNGHYACQTVTLTAS